MLLLNRNPVMFYRPWEKGKKKNIYLAQTKGQNVAKSKK